MKNYTKILFILIVFYFVSLPIQKVAAFTGSGAGIGGDPYLITTCAQFIEINSSLGAYYRLENDVNCSLNGNNIQAGTPSTSFYGNFNGGGHTVTVNINFVGNEVGLFRRVESATISDVRVAGTILGTNYVGGITGTAYGVSTLSRVVNNARIGTNLTGSNQIRFGGILGYADGGSVSVYDSYNTGDVGERSENLTMVGGILGYGGTVTIERTYNRGALSGAFPGGLIGYLSGGGVTIKNSFNVGKTYSGYDVYGGWPIGKGGLFGTWEYYGLFPGGISNNYFDQSRTTKDKCWHSTAGFVSPYPEKCEIVNPSWDAPDYFKNNSTSRPFVDLLDAQAWDFDNVWETVSNGYPALRAINNDEIAVNDIPQVPAAPTELFVADRGETSAELQWVNNGDTYVPTTYFYVEYKKTTENSWTVIDTQLTPVDINAPALTIPGLEHSSFYNVRVKAFNTVGGGEYSDVLTFSPGTPQVLASAPLNLAVEAAEDPLVVDVSWEAPTSSGDYPLLSYQVQVKYSTSTWDDLVVFRNVAVPTVEFPGLAGLKNSLTYDIRVLPKTVAGFGAPSNTISYETPIANVHYIKNCSDSVDEENFGLQGVDNNVAFRDDLFKLANDIDCDGIAFVPLVYATGGTQFEGVFDGQNYAISNLNIPVPLFAYNGLFGSIYDAVVKNLTIEITVVSGNGVQHTGSIAGHGNGYISIANVHANVTFALTHGSQTSHIGGLIGDFSVYNNSQSTLSVVGSSVEGSITVPNGYGIGGIAGYVDCDDEIAPTRKCFVIQNNEVSGTITVDGGDQAGGIIGDALFESGSGGIVSGNSFEGLIDGGNGYGGYMGGIIGYYETYTNVTSVLYVANNTTQGSMSSVYSSGGIIGYYYNRGNIPDSTITFVNNHSSMDIVGESYIGGLVGDFENGFWGQTAEVADPETISNSSFTGTITNTDGDDGSQFGGLIGYAEAYALHISKCFSSATITGGYYLGGFIGEGYNNISVDDSYFSGNVVGVYEWGAENIGGIFGYAYGDDPELPTVIRNSYVSGNVTGDDIVGGLVGETEWQVGIENSFFEGSIIVGGEPTAVGALIGRSDDPMHSFENITYNSFKSTPFPCVGDPNTPEDFDSCLGVNVENATPDYYKYNLTNAPMSSWNTSTVWRKVPNDYPKLRWNVIDSSAPVLTITGATTVTVANGATYIDDGATAIDDFDGNVTSEIVVTNPVDTMVAGTYYVLFDVCDSDDNCAVQQSRRVDVEAVIVPTPTSTPSSNQDSNSIVEEEIVTLPKTVVLKDSSEYLAGSAVSFEFTKKDKFVAQLNDVDYLFEIVEIGDNYVTLKDKKGARTLIEVGQKIQLDLDGDGKNDIDTTLMSVIDGQAEISFQEILGTQIEVSPTATPTISPTQKAVAIQKKKLPLWAWSLLIVPVGFIWVVLKSSRNNRG